MSANQKLKLAHPVQVDGKAMAEITIRRPKVKDIRAIDTVKDQGDLQQGLTMACLLTGLPPDVLDEMDAGDFARVSEVVMSFLPKSRAQETGAP
jgi:hypothetical protein